MITRLRNRAISRMGLGLSMFGFFGLLLAVRNRGVPEVISVLGLLLLGIGGIIFYLQGCVALAEAKGHTDNVVVAAIVFSTLFFPLVLPLLPVVLIFALEDRNKAPGGQVRRRRHQYGSYLERIVHYRRNALLGIYFGLPCIALGVLLVVFPVGIFWDPANEKVLGMFVFLGGYAAVIAGCCYWLKAKALPDAIVCIGLAPLALPFIPYVRLIVRIAPVILPLGMVMMPLILIVVILALGDRSGVPGRRYSSGWNRAGLRWLQRASVAAQVRGSNPQAGANRGQPVSPETNQKSPAAGSGRSP